MSTMTLEPCPFCGKSGPFDHWPCRWLDATGANIVRCPYCSGAAPLATWNTRAISGEKAGPVDGWTKRQIAVTRYALWRFAQEARSHASSAAQQREDGDAAIASSFLDDAAVAEQVRTLLPASPAPDKEGKA